MSVQAIKLEAIPSLTEEENSDACISGSVHIILDKVSQPYLLPAQNLIFGMIKGTFKGFTEQSEPLVECANNLSGPTAAEAIVILTPADIGRTVTIQFEHGDPRKPLITGIVRKPEEMARAAKAERLLAILSECAELKQSGERLVLLLSKDARIRCGESLLELTQGGKIILEGKDILSRSWGMNRLEGAAVKVN